MNTRSNKHHQRGQGIVEVAVLLSLVAASTIAAMSAYGVSLRDVYCDIGSAFGVDQKSCAPKTLLDDDFSNLDGWNILTGPGWKPTGDKLCVGYGTNHQALTGDEDWKDYTINLDISDLKRHRGRSGYGAYFRTTLGPGSGYGHRPNINGYIFKFDPYFRDSRFGGGRNGSFVIRRVIKGKEFWPPIAVGPAPPDFDFYSAPKNLSLNVDGDTFIATVDGEQVLKASDRTFTEGGIGLRVWGGTVACFDNLTITEP